MLTHAAGASIDSNYSVDTIQINKNKNFVNRLFISNKNQEISIVTKRFYSSKTAIFDQHVKHILLLSDYQILYFY